MRDMRSCALVCRDWTSTACHFLYFSLYVRTADNANRLLNAGLETKRTQKLMLDWPSVHGQLNRPPSALLAERLINSLHGLKSLFLTGLTELRSEVLASEALRGKCESGSFRGFRGTSIADVHCTLDVTRLNIRRDASIGIVGDSPFEHLPENSTCSFHLTDLLLNVRSSHLNIPISVFDASHDTLTTLKLASDLRFSLLRLPVPTITTSFYTTCFPLVANNLTTLFISRLDESHKSLLLPVIGQCTRLRRLAIRTGTTEQEHHPTRHICMELGTTRLSALEVHDKLKEEQDALVQRVVELLALPLCKEQKELQVLKHGEEVWERVKGICEARRICFGAFEERVRSSTRADF